MKPFIVKVRNAGDTKGDEIWPDGSPRGFDKRGAKQWFDYLVECGRRGVPVQGKRFVHVRIEDTTIPGPVGAFVNGQTVPYENVMLAQYCYDDPEDGPDKPCGLWANELKGMVN